MMHEVIAELHGDGLSFRWDDLSVVLAVHRERTLAAAAGRLGVDASTVSRRLRALEEALGSRLFERTPDGLLPTDLVRRILPHAEAADAAARAVAAEAAGNETTATGLVRVAAANAMAAYVLAPRLTDLLEAHPGLRVELLVSTDLVDLTRFEADIAVRFVRPVQGDLVVRRLATTDAYGAFVHESHLERFGPLEGRPSRWIGWSSSKAHLADAQLYEQLVGVPPRLACDDMVVQIEAWRRGGGAMLFPVALGRLTPGSVLLDDPEVVPYDVEVFIVTHRSMRQVPRVRVVRDWLVSVLEDYDSQSSERQLPK